MRCMKKDMMDRTFFQVTKCDSIYLITDQGVTQKLHRVITVEMGCLLQKIIILCKIYKCLFTSRHNIILWLELKARVVYLKKQFREKNGIKNKSRSS